MKEGSLVLPDHRMAPKTVDHGLLEPLEQPVPLRQRIYQALEELIIFGALRPGQHLVESRLAHRLGVSRVPIREALQLLYRDG